MTEKPGSATSLSLMVPIALADYKVAPTGLLSTMLNVSVSSTSASSVVGTEIVFCVWPGLNINVWLLRTVKSAALAAVGRVSTTVEYCTVTAVVDAVDNLTVKAESTPSIIAAASMMEIAGNPPPLSLSMIVAVASRSSSVKPFGDDSETVKTSFD